MKAFPAYEYQQAYDQMMAVGGMELRDYFAAKAMQAVAVVHSHEKDVARNAYKIADAMMEARK
jgi:hypothetical protein